MAKSGPKVKPISIRFWEKVKISDKDSCWEYTGTVLRAGYGQVKINGRRYMAHRISWILTFGPIPDGLLVCHKCDNPPCCNPDHLFLGTYADNLHDAQKKGRAHGANPGELHHNAKLSANDVLNIRAIYRNEKTSHQKLAAMFGVSRGQIGRILNYERWRLI